MAEAARRRATYEDVLAAPRHVVAELVRGVLQTHPRPAPPHARASSKLGSRLGRAFDDGEGGPGGWWILDEPELHLPSGDVLVPDLAGWRLERMPALPTTPFFELVPDWICEVLSPSTEADDRADKMPIYAEAGVEHAWLVDPILKTLEIHRRAGDRWLVVATHKGDMRCHAEPFDAIELELGQLWAPPAAAR
jgi:Uma2 family endonuclease